MGNCCDRCAHEIQRISGNIFAKRAVLCLGVLLAYTDVFVDGSGFDNTLENLARCGGGAVQVAAEYVTVTGFYAGLGFIICFSWAKQAQQDAILAKDANNQEAIKSKKFWRLIFWVAITLVFVTTCVVCCMISRIVLAIKVIQVSHEKAK